MTLELGTIEIKWGLWLKWVVGHALGGFVGLVLGFIGTVAGLAIGRGETTVGGVLALVLGGSGFGLGIGAIQWIVLRREVYWRGGWVSASIGGGGVGIVAGMIGGGSGILGSALALGPNADPAASAPTLAPMIYVVVVASYGAVIGIIQWLVLRREIDEAGWWILANILGSAIGTTVGIASAAGINAIVGFLAGFVTFGIITGVALVWLLREE